MTIRKRLYQSFGTILAMVLVLLLINLAALYRERAARDASAQALKMAETLSALRFQMIQNRLFLGNYLLSGDTREVDRLMDGEREVSRNVTAAKGLITTEQQGAGLERIASTEQSWANDLAQPMISKRREVDAGNGTVAELQIFYMQKDPAKWVKESTDSLDMVERENSKVLAKRRESDDTLGAWTILVSLLGTLLAVGLGSLIAYRTATAVTQPLHDLMNVAQQIAENGDLDHKISTERQDEMGKLAHSFSAMVSYLKEMAGVSESIAGGDLTVEAEPRSGRDTLGNAFVSMVAGLRKLARSVREAASQVASGSAQVASASEESAKIGLQASGAIDEVTSTMHEMSVNVQNMVKSTQMQSSSVSETSASIDEMVASIQRVADTAKVLLDISNRSREEVLSGITTMDKATDGLNKINHAITESGEIIGSLGQRADDIGSIVEVIDDLAEQTNLLALNAAIEAARAGEHGLGFAVVADEVRKLAEKSAQSTKEISGLIQSIQKEARRAVDNMQKSTSIVDEGLTLGQDLNTALKKIANVVTEVYKFAQEIGAATNEQSHGSSQIARATTRLNEVTHEINSAVEEQASGAQAVVRAMERMRELVQQSTSGSTELAASAEQMSRMSRTLLESIDGFRLRGESGATAAGPRPDGKFRSRAAGTGH
jgi:methyl-accepting chemotaxis protein